MSGNTRRPSSARRPSTTNREDFVYQCKAAYLCVVNDTSYNLTEKRQLKTALNQSGRNPSKKNLDKYWRGSTEELTFDDFCDICKQETVASEDDLMKAFHKIDINGDGYISHSELYTVLTTKGEKMSRQEVKDMIAEVDENKDGKLDYKEFCKFLLSTTNDCKKLAKEKLDKRSQKSQPSSARSKDRTSDDSPRTKKTGKNNGVTVTKASPKLKKKSSQTSLKLEEKSAVVKKPIVNNVKASIGARESDDDDDIVMPSSKSSKDSSLKTPPRPQPQPRKLSQNLEQNTESLLSKSTPDDVPRPSPRATAIEEKVFGPLSTKRIRLPEPRHLKDWDRHHSKGCFFIEDDGDIISHQYSLDLKEDSSVWITIQPLVLHPEEDVPKSPVDTALFVLRDRPDSNGNRLVTFTEQRDQKGKYCVRCDLKRGHYTLVPFTTGCRLKQRTSDPKVETKLIKKDKDDYTLTKSFREVLSDVFEVNDLDSNGLLSRSEFSWYNMRTSGESVGDEEWEVVEENVELKNGELTRAGFIDLNKMEADDQNGDTSDLWVTLQSMGYNKGLVMDEAAPFKLEVYTENSGTFKVKSLSSPGSALEKALCESVINKGDCQKVRGMKDLLIHTYAQDFRTTIVVENKSNSSISLLIDCSGSKNCNSSRNKLEHKIQVAANSSVVALHVMAQNERLEWIFRCSENIVK